MLLTMLNLDTVIVMNGFYILKVVEIGGGTDDGACVSTHTLVGSGGMFPQKIRYSEIASEVIFVPNCH